MSLVWVKYVEESFELVVFGHLFQHQFVVMVDLVDMVLVDGLELLEGNASNRVFAINVNVVFGLLVDWQLLIKLISRLFDELIDSSVPVLRIQKIELLNTAFFLSEEGIIDEIVFECRLTTWFLDLGVFASHLDDSIDSEGGLTVGIEFRSDSGLFIELALSL